MSNSVPMEFPIDYIENGDGTMKPVYQNQGSRLRVYFKKTKRPDVQRTLLTGKEQFIEEILLYKKVKGSTNITASRATEADKRIFRKEWEAFRQGETKEVSYSIIDLYGVKPSDVQMLSDLGIHSIDDLAQASDELIQGLPGGLDLRKLARIWIRSRKEEEESSKALVLLDSYREENKALLAEIERLKSEVEFKQKLKPGRPKKSLSDLKNEE